MKTGNTARHDGARVHAGHASMEPGHEDREYKQYLIRQEAVPDASMEPGHEDREYDPEMMIPGCTLVTPQWSPVMKTGNTGAGQDAAPPF